jgi:hypothetical protein
LIFPDGHKAIVDLEHQFRELYDLGSDPGEKENLADGNEHASSYFGALAKFFRAHRGDKPGYEAPFRQF